MKFGSYSIILEPQEYGKFGFSFKGDNRLMKICNIDNFDSNKDDTEVKNDSKSVIKMLMNKKDSMKYVCKVYEEVTSISKKSELYKFLEGCLFEGEKHNIIINNNNLGYCLLENGGSKDLFDILDNIYMNEWHVFITDTNNKLLNFIEHMLNAVNYLHENSISHFDIKPENIVYSNNLNIKFGERFKLIDFDFSEKYPFTNYRIKLKGSTHYTPFKKYSKNYLNTMPSWAKNDNYTDWLFRGNEFVHYVEYMNLKTYELIYKIDIYALGIVFNQLVYYLTHIDKYTCFNCDSCIVTLIQNMTYYDLIKRYNSDECLIYFKNYIDNKIVDSQKECKIKINDVNIHDVNIHDISYNFCEEDECSIINEKNNTSGKYISNYFNLIYNYFNRIIA